MEEELEKRVMGEGGKGVPGRLREVRREGM